LGGYIYIYISDKMDQFIWQSGSLGDPRIAADSQVIESIFTV